MKILLIKPIVKLRQAKFFEDIPGHVKNFKWFHNTRFYTLLTYFNINYCVSLLNFNMATAFIVLISDKQACVIFSLYRPETLNLRISYTHNSI
jgi:hypothetical protein